MANWFHSFNILIGCSFISSHSIASILLFILWGFHSVSPAKKYKQGIPLISLQCELQAIVEGVVIRLTVKISLGG